jgi:uncharacterized protein YbjQ (UPF0145 family)
VSLDTLEGLPQLQAWIADSRLHVSVDGATRSFARLDGVRVRLLASDRYLVALVGEDDSPIVAIANRDNCRAICRTGGVVIPQEGVDLVHGSAPSFGLDIEELASVTPDEQRLPVHIQILTISAVPGCVVSETLGMVTGSTVRTRHLGAKLVAGISQNFGGELGGYTRLLQDARDEAVARMIDHARSLGADAVVGFRLATADLFDLAVEMLAYGTAVRTTVASSDPLVDGSNE